MQKTVMSSPFVAGVCLLLLGSPDASGQQWAPSSPEKRCPSPWGANDERGAANHMTPATVLKGLRLVKEGKVYELGRVLEPDMPIVGQRHFGIHTARSSGPSGTNQVRANEELVVTELGQIGTQFDGLPHVAIGDTLYNCVKTEEVATRTGFTRLGVEKVGGIVTRGVLLDVAAAKGVEMLQVGYEITVADLESAMKRQGLTIGAGDAVLIHTGWGRLWMKDNARYNSGQPGIGVAAAEWLAGINPILVGADNWGIEVIPNPDNNLVVPVHQIMIATHGIFLLENLALDALAREQVAEFALMVSPLKIKGGTGSTVAPIAMK